MPVDVAAYLDGHAATASRTPNPLAEGLKGSRILAIAGEVNAMKAQGAPIVNLTIGDFDPKQFPVPSVLVDLITEELRAGHTNYPPASGTAELQQAILDSYRDELGLRYPAGSVLVGSGARPPFYAAFGTIVAPGDEVLYPVPSWNTRHYAYLNGGVPVPVPTRPENGFMPTFDELAPHLGTARVLLINSPSNPAGTVIREDLLRDIALAVVAENKRREAAGARPLILIYDQVYWRLVFGDAVHFTPVGLVPEVAPYCVMIDAISKCWAATGLRVGWAVAPPWIIGKMNPLIGHTGAWAPKPEQRATATLLRQPERLGDYMTVFKAGLERRLTTLWRAFQALKAEGYPVDALAPAGALYLSAKIDLLGRTVDGTRIETDDDLRRALLQVANVAVVPFDAFGYAGPSGWVRLSVGAVSEDGALAAAERIGALVRSACR
jgi:aspartate aminotransferase